MPVFNFPFKAMACPCEIQIVAPGEVVAQAASARAVAEVQRIENKYSRYRPDSIISRINRAAGSGKAVSCDDETQWLLGFADTLFAASDGLFDITAGILRQAWNFSVPRVPSAEELAPLLEKIDWSLVERSGRKVSLPLAGMEIDFGGFGKEYAADRAADALIAEGVTSGYVNLGGDIRVIGPQPDGQPWVIGVQNPRAKEQIVASIPLYDGGLATSGDYEKFFEVDGCRYCHVLNPKSGLPVRFWQSVSIQAPRALAAGSATTIAMLKERDGVEFLKNTGFVYLAIDNSGRLYNNDLPENQT